MSSEPTILVSAHALAFRMASLGALLWLSGCGLKGNLYLPDDPDFQGRATLPEIVRRQFPDMPPPRKPGEDASAPTKPSESTAPSPSPSR